MPSLTLQGPGKRRYVLERRYSFSKKRDLLVGHYVEVLTPEDDEAWFYIRRSG